MTTAAFILIAYLIGSLSFAVIVSRAFGLPDPHSYGSGNPGATNVLRSGRKSAAALTLIGDVAKGWLAVFLAGSFADAQYLLFPVVPPGWAPEAKRIGSRDLSPRTGIRRGGFDWWVHEGADERAPEMGSGLHSSAETARKSLSSVRGSLIS